MGTTAQLNVRLDPQLKAAGDAALAELGFTPSEAVRALWTRAARRGQEAIAVKSFLAGDAIAMNPGAPSSDQPVSPAERLGWDIVSNGMAKLGVSASSHGSDWPTDEELLARALQERMTERGLL